MNDVGAKLAFGKGTDGGDVGSRHKGCVEDSYGQDMEMMGADVPSKGEGVMGEFDG
jgi:hypothetical protein